ncbi:MAG: DUF1592 domain-containing protein [Opitutaceae bacterium]|nr:DUF1592 domain-containing protein [Verrucomicrobiales bacterium]
MKLNSPWLLGAALGLWLGAVQGHSAPVDFRKVALPFMEKYCYECHGGKKTKADLDLKQIKDDKTILQDHKQWRGILHQLNTGEMPPQKQTLRPSPAEITAFNQAIEESFARAEAKMPLDPGRVTSRRLNRTEYNNTVRDLLAVDYNPAENFPADDIGYGFDNIGDVLSMSPVHLERYLDAAEGIAARAVFVDPPKPATRTTAANFLEPGGYRSENGVRPVTNSPPELFVRHEIKIAGKYAFRVRAGATNAADAEAVHMALLVGDKELTNSIVTAGSRRGKEFEVELDLPAGEHRFSARFVNRDTNVTDRILFINEFKVIGPADVRTDFMRRVADVGAGKPDAIRVREVVEWFLTRAFRRPPTKSEMARYENVLSEGRAMVKDRFEAGLQELVRAVLSSPKFLFRVELDSRPDSPAPHGLDEFQLASRMSYFLWSTMPDEELLSLAARKQLTPNLGAQVRRMLKDPKSVALVQNFGLQWLQLQRLSTFQPDATMFPDFNEGLRKSMLRETELFLGEIIREDRSVLELVDADFTYVNRTLARHYGLENVAFKDSSGSRSGRRQQGGGEFVRVNLPEKQRGGLLTQASILTVTSNPTRTSPVKRGKWVLEQILGTPPPPPPPNVPELDEQHELKGTLRQRMEQHRSNPACSSCHQQMDALGFAFENFDAIGRFRAKDGEGVIDPAGALPDGRMFNGPSELKGILRDKKELLARNLTEKMMIYGLGRGLEFYDERAIKKTMAELAQADYKFSALVSSIVKSDPFRMRRGKESNEPLASAK